MGRRARADRLPGARQAAAVINSHFLIAHCAIADLIPRSRLCGRHRYTLVCIIFLRKLSKGAGLRESHANPSLKITDVRSSSAAQYPNELYDKRAKEDAAVREIANREIPKNLVGFSVPTAEPTLAFAGATNEQIPVSRGSSRR